MPQAAAQAETGDERITDQARGSAMKFARVLKHLVMLPGALGRAFPKAALDSVTEAIADSERAHSGEIRFAVEASLPWSYLWKNLPARSRAMMVFSKLRVWDTEANNGVLIYVLLADRSVDIVADRGIAVRVAQQQWNAVCDTMRERFHGGDFAGGAIAGVQGVGALLAEHFPERGARDNPNELSNAPAVL